MADEIDSMPTPVAAVHPPTINHLFVLMLTTAFAFANYAPRIAEFRQAQSQGATAGDWFSLVNTMLDAFFMGVVYFGLVIVVREAVRHRSCAWMAFGHWFLLLIGFQYLLGDFSELILTRLYVHKREWWQSWGNAFSAATFILLGTLWLTAAIRIKKAPWRVAAIGFALIHLGSLAFPIYRIGKEWGWWTNLPLLHIFGPIGTIHAGLAIAVVVNWIAAIFHRGQRYDWLHRLGLVALFFFCLGSLLSFRLYTVQWWSGFYTHLLNWLYPI